MNKQYKRLIRICLGWLLIVIGIAGLFLPIVQGMPLIIAGIYVLSRECLWAKKLLAQFKKRFPGLAGKIDSFRRKIKS